MPRAIAKGCRTRDHDRPQVVVRLDEDMFEEVRQRAEREKTSFGEQVRILVEWGLEAARNG